MNDKGLKEVKIETNRFIEFLKYRVHYIVAVLVFIIVSTRVYRSIISVCFMVIFLITFSLAKYFEKSIKLKYIFAIISYIACFFTLINLHITSDYMIRFILLFPIFYAYLLKESFVPNIMEVGIVFAFYFFRNSYKLEELIIVLIGSNIIIVSQIITARMLDRLKIERNNFHLASITDSLTGFFTLDQILKNGQELLDKGLKVSVFLIDIDHFKDINDTYGYFKGNNVLIQMAEILKNETLKIKCEIGRVGGDGFVILAQDLSKLQEKQFVKKLYERFEEEVFFIDAAFENIKVSSSVGVAQRSSKAIESIEKLLNSANLDMYYNKIQNKNKFSIIEKDDTHLYNKLVPEEYKNILKILAEKDMYTYVHSKYTAKYAFELGQKLELPDSILKGVYIAGWIHDIGKILISNEILRKPDKLTESEYDVIKRHVKSGFDILSNIETLDSSEVIINAMKYHHEQWNGRGYPNSISGAFTPIEGRILQIADAFSAMTIKRVFREPISIADAIEEIHAKSGTQFDPSLAKLFIQHLHEKFRPINLVEA